MSSATLFRWSKPVHAGDGAEDCPLAKAAADGTPRDELPECDSPGEHFHSWCRLPNALEQERIMDRAIQARAARVRELRDPDADAYVVMDTELLALDAISTDAELIDEILQSTAMEDRMAARQEVIEEAEDDAYASIEADLRRLNEIQDLDPEVRDDAELKRLEDFVGEFISLIDAKAKEFEAPRRENLEGKGRGELIDEVRSQRISTSSFERFVSARRVATWVVGTRHPVTRRQLFANEGELINESPEVIEALATAFYELEEGHLSGNA